MAACVAPNAAAAAAAQPQRAGLKRKRIPVGSSEQYEETCRLGAGAFGSVVRARHRATGRDVAIKRPCAAGGDGPMEILREASMLEEACAGNPFVVAFQGVVRDPGTMDLGLVMECVGSSLHDLLRKRRRRGAPPLSEAMVRAAMWQLLTGAKKMHGSGIVHRDIKPQNILVGADHSIVKICDFGLAMSMSERPQYDAVGTRWYKAPELLLDKPSYGAEVDAWALGCVMAELVNNGRPLFQGVNDQAQICAIFALLGVPDNNTWPWFSSTPFATVVVPEVNMQRHNLLRKLFPETKLSKEGFDVLSGLLTCNPDKRLTAAAALDRPWFSVMDKLVLPVPKKDDMALQLPKRLCL